MKRSLGFAAGMLGIAMLFGCSARATIIDSTPDTEKIQIVGQIETPAPTEEAQQDAVAENAAVEIVVTDAPEPTEAPTPEPTPVPTEKPSEEPTPEPTEEPTPEPAPVFTEEPAPESEPESVISESRSATAEKDVSKAEKLCEIAKSLLDTPYQRGGTKPESGFDPGGFVYHCLNKAGVKVSHKSSKGYSEYDAWERVDSIDELLPGDLCFFMTPGNESVNCVCIYLGGGKIIYPSSGEGRVITAKITGSYWTEAFVFARRVF